jgi:hypothetical protein
MSLSDFRASFVRYAEENKFEIPSTFKNATDVEFAIAVNMYLRPHAHDLDLCYSNLQALIMVSGCEVPELNAEQKTKVKRFLQAFIKATE